MKPSRLLAPALVAMATLVIPAVQAKLPPPSDEAKAKAAEAAAKTSWAAKVQGYKLCKIEDQLAAAYLAKAKREGKTVGTPVATPPCVDPGPFKLPS
jgi:hypothetical protein